MQRYGEDYAVTSLDKDAKVATLANGQSIQYDALVSTMPLDITLRWLGLVILIEGGAFGL